MLFEAMMDRIEDETVRYLYFLSPAQAERAPAPLVVEEDYGGEPEPAAVAEVQRAAAQSSIQDFTRNIQRRKDKEMADLQFAGGGAATAVKQPIVKAHKVGRNDPCPCGSGKKYKKCCGA